MNRLWRWWRRDPRVYRLEAQLAVARGEVQRLQDRNADVRAELALALRQRNDARRRAEAADVAARALGDQLRAVRALAADQTLTAQQALDRISQVLTEGGGGGRG